MVLFLAYLAQARTLPVHLDVASASGPQTMQAWDMLHGNVLLSGWSVGDVSYYTTELPEYVLVLALRGLNGDAVHIVAALNYTLMVLLAAVLAKGRATGREGLVRALIAAGIMLAPALAGGTSVVLSGPDHTGTQVPLLLIFLVLDRAPERWWTPVLVSVMLVWAMMADMLVLYQGVVAILVVCAVRMFRRRGPWRGHWFELSLAGGALAAVAAARAALVLIWHAGGFYVRMPTGRIASAHQLVSQLGTKLERVLGTFSADFIGPGAGRATIFALFHVVGFVLVVWAVVLGVRHIFTNDLVAQVLTAGFGFMLVAYLFGTRPNPNEIIGLLPMGAALAGRLLAGRLIRIRRLIPVLAVVLAINGIALAASAAQPAASYQSHPSAAWFEARHLSSGLAGFGQAWQISVDSGDRVHVSPVRVFRGRLVTTPWENSTTWYDPSTHYANFVVVQRFKCGHVCGNVSELEALFGPAARTYDVGKDRVLVWNQNLLTNVPVLSWCEPNVWEWTASGKPSVTPCR